MWSLVYTWANMASSSRSSRPRNGYRSPDSRHIPEEDKIMFEKLHDAVGRTKFKIKSLEDEVVSKERAAAREEALRREAERKQHEMEEKRLVDMYGDSGVNEELKERLSPETLRRKRRGESPSPTPRSTEKHVRFEDRRSSESSITSLERRQEEEEAEEEESRDFIDDEQDGERRQLSRRDMNASPGRGQRDYRRSPPRGRPRPPPPPPWDRRNDYYDDEEYYDYYDDDYYEDEDYYEGPPTLPLPPRRSRSPGAGRPRSAPPRWGSPGSPAGRRRRRRPDYDQYEEEEDMDIRELHARSPTKNQESQTVNQSDQSLQVDTTADQSSFVNISFDTSKDKPEEEAGKSLSLLLTELDAVKEENRQLKAKLSEAERDLQGMQLQESLLEKSYEAQLAEKGAELIHEIHQAQKERESAVMNRLRLANEERDEALLRCKRIEVAKDQLPSSEGDYSLGDATLDELLDRIAKAETGTAIERDGQMILDRINNTKNRKKRITSEEMRAIIDERDSAAEKVKRLEQELAGYRKNADRSGKAVVPRQNNQEQALKEQLAATRQERDMSFAKIRKLEEEVQQLQVYYSLHKSLSQEASMREQFNNTLNVVEDQLAQRDTIVMQTHRYSEELALQLKGVLEERGALEAQLQQARQGQQEAQDRAEKLERLVNVLRKKISGGVVKTVN
ncbi:PREDICTED: trichohyalin-like [Branchiostoma belcheri]|uniref:Trichohyalin-like n=1 Tax=Branchiostoma belcheri TaxID=7741 RepID=A0A6P4YXG1_BRABE|nr:PREDICTED: trichohyalin-like [Branchiostoma belcheri]